MPLIIAVLVILVIIFNLRDSSKQSAQMSAVHANTRRKTCAYMEHQLVCRYMLHGMSFDEAFQRSYQDMVDAGYEPCIPKEAYFGGGEKRASTRLGANKYALKKHYYDYDSQWVRDIFVSKSMYDNRKRVERPHPILPSKKYWSPMEVYQEIHKDFPKTDYEFGKAMDRLSLEHMADPIGSFLIYPGYGTCEVLGYNYNYDKTKGTYVLRCLKTGEIINHVKIGDPQISYQGQ